MKLVGPDPSDPLDGAPKAYVDRAVNCVLDFGSPDEDTTAQVYVPAAWANLLRPVVCVPDPDGTADHSAEDYVIEGVVAQVTAVSPGAGFTVTGYAAEGTFGQYLISCAG